MIVRALDAGMTASWVAGDEVYGADPQLRNVLEERLVGYVLAVACSHPYRHSGGQETRRRDRQDTAQAGVATPQRRPRAHASTTGR